MAAARPVGPAFTVDVLAATDAEANDGLSSGRPGDSIGQAWLEPDGTLVLQLRAQTPGLLGDGCLRVSPREPRYQEYLAHLGGLVPGQVKPVPPWPDAGPQRV